MTYHAGCVSSIHYRDSYVHSSLNKGLINKFTADEIAKIRKTYISDGYSGGYDYMFLLSGGEVLDLFTDNSDRQACSKSTSSCTSSSWMLRDIDCWDHNSTTFKGSLCNACHVGSDGSTACSSVSTPVVNKQTECVYPYYGIRPALWLNLNQ